MRIIVNSAQLSKKLQLISGVLNSSNTLPILDNFLFDAQDNQLKITASDLETTMSVVLNIESSQNGLIAIPARLLIEMLKTFPEQPLAFETLENNTIEINSISGKYNLAFYPGEEFPKEVQLADPLKAEINSKILNTAITKTVIATGNDELRQMMTGVYFQFSPECLTFAATDAHKLVEYVRTDVVASKEANFIMPKKPLQVLKSALALIDSLVTIEYNDHNAKFVFEDYEVSCRLINAKYPNYKSVIPKENPNILIINRIQLLNAIKSVSIFSNKETHQVRLKLAGSELKISAEDRDYSNKADEVLTCNYQGNDMEIGFNSRFLMEMISNVNSEEIQLEMSLPNRAGILKPIDGTIEGEEILMLVMPSLIS